MMAANGKISMKIRIFVSLVEKISIAFGLPPDRYRIKPNPQKILLARNNGGVWWACLVTGTNPQFKDSDEQIDDYLAKSPPGNGREYKIIEVSEDNT